MTTNIESNKSLRTRGVYARPSDISCCKTGLGRERVAHRIQTVSPQGIGVRDFGRRGMRQQKNGAVDWDVEARGGGHKPGDVRERCRSSASHSDVGHGQFRYFV